MKQLVFSPSAWDDLRGILRYIARDKPVAAARFVDRLRRECDVLAQYPDLGTAREDLATGLRVFTYRGYGIYYRNLDDRVRIDRVLHPSLDVTKQRFD